MKVTTILILFGLCLNMFQIGTVQDKMTKAKNILPSNTKVTREMLAKGTYKNINGAITPIKKCPLALSLTNIFSWIIRKLSQPSDVLQRS